MRALFLVLLFPALAAAEPINAVVGDASWIARTGHAPTPAEDARETLRIRTHLGYVLDLLQRADVSHLDSDVLRRRRALLAELVRYRAAGAFPRNEAHPGRRPRFIDDEGRLCAVGHLLVASGHRALAERIDREHEYEFVADIPVPALRRWADEHGFTTRELATIQPSYRRPPPPPRPQLTEDVLRRLMRRAHAGVQTCVQRARPDRGHRVRLEARVRGTTVDLRVNVRPASPDAEACARRVVTRRVRLLLARFDVRQPVRVRDDLRVPPRVSPTPQSSGFDATLVHAYLQRATPQLRRCLAGTSAVPGQVTLQILVQPDGRLSLRGASLPRGAGDGAVLSCLSDVVVKARLRSPPRAPLTVRHSLRLGRTPTR